MAQFYVLVLGKMLLARVQIVVGYHGDAAADYLALFG